MRWRLWPGATVGRSSSSGAPIAAVRRPTTGWSSLTGIPEIDRRAAADAESAGIWVNSADDADHCTFFLPSVHRQGAVSVSVSTGGASPALAAWLRRRIGETLGPHLGTLAELLEEGRASLRAAGRPTSAVDWTALLDGELPGLVSDGRLDEARGRIDAAVARAIAGNPSTP
jgi:siroheme synthase-like protein